MSRLRIPALGRRGRWLWALGLFAAVCVFGIVLWRTSHRNPPAEDRTEQARAGAGKLELPEVPPWSTMTEYAMRPSIPASKRPTSTATATRTWSSETS